MHALADFCENLLRSPAEWHFCGLLLIVFLTTLNERARGQNIFVLASWHFCGSLLHELAHLLVGTLLLGGACGFSLFPKPTGDGGWQLGCVEFRRLNAFNSLPIGLAPLGLVGIAYWIYSRWDRWFTPGLFSTLGLYLLLFLLLYDALPSRQDLRVAFTATSVVLWAGGLFLLGVVCSNYPFIVD